MKKIKVGKLMAFLFVLMLTVIGTMRMTASAEAIDPANVVVDYVNETVIVTTDKDSIVYFTEVYHKDVSRWDACEVREKTDASGKTVKNASFDISWINENKTVRLYLCGDVNTDVISVDITWEETFDVKFYGTLLTTDITEAAKWKQIYAAYPNFSEDTGYFIFTIEENGRDMSYFDLENIEWRKGNSGVWRKYKELDLKEMNIRGIKLEFRVIANDTDRASSTASISVSRLLSAPVILVNPDTMTLGIKNGMEFSFDKEEWILVPEYDKKFGTEEYMVTEDVRNTSIKELYTNKRVNTILMQEVLKTKIPGFTMNTSMSKASLEGAYKNVLTLTDEGIVLYVRDIGTERKAASKIAEVIIPYASDAMANAQEGALKFSYGESKTNTGGIVVENTSIYKYQVGIITPEEWKNVTDPEDIDLTGMKWTSIRGGKMMKIANKKVPEGSYMIYRIAGEDGHLPSTYEIYGPMEYNELTYAGIAAGKKLAGEKMEAVVSTNFTKKADGTYDGLTFQWQRCDNVKVDNPQWVNIDGATSPVYELTKDDATKYVRVVVTNRVTVSGVPKEIVWTTEEEGPITYVPPKEEEKEEGKTEGTEDNKGATE